MPIITAFAQRHDLHDTPMIVAADAGMLSGANLKELDEAGLSFIVGPRTVKAPGDLASHFHWNGDHFNDGQIIDTVTPRHGNTIVNDRSQRAEPVWNPNAHPGAWRAIWQYSARRARRDQQTLNAQEARAKAVIDGELDGVGPVLAARLLGRTGAPRRFESAAAYANYTGTAPVQIASADSNRHRLSRYGDRQLNSAIYTWRWSKSVCPRAPAAPTTTRKSQRARHLDTPCAR